MTSYLANTRLIFATEYHACNTRKNRERHTIRQIRLCSVCARFTQWNKVAHKYSDVGTIRFGVIHGHRKESVDNLDRAWNSIYELVYFLKDLGPHPDLGATDL
jgi:hypothetical protein